MMKTSLRVIGLAILIILLVLSLTACGGGGDGSNGDGNGGNGNGGNGGGGSDDHGNSIPFATFISLNDNVNGNIETSGDVDYFAFRAYNGETYSIETGTGTLTDTVIYLYNENSFQIDSDDDSGVGLASKIIWTCDLPQHIISGTYYVRVEAFGSNATGTYTLKVQETSGGNGGGGIHSVTLYATADTYVSSGSPNQNFGSTGGLYTGEVSSSSYRVFVKFNVSSIPGNAQVNQATLYLNTGRNSVPCNRATSATVTISEVLYTSWTENGLTYFNMPSSFRWLSSKTITNLDDCVSHNHSFNVTDAVQDWANGVNPNLGISIKSSNINDYYNTGQSYCTLYSKEVSSSAGPQLYVEYTD